MMSFNLWGIIPGICDDTKNNKAIGRFEDQPKKIQIEHEMQWREQNEETDFEAMYESLYE